MERIQSAIAKARAARTGQPDADAPQPERRAAATPPAPPAPSTDAVAAAWAALPELNPSAKHLARNRIVAFAGGHDATGFDVIRTRVLQQMRTNNWRRLAIVSPGPGCGKSVVATNLAFSLGRLPDQRALVADMDMRRSSMARLLGITRRHNFARVLEGAAAFEDNAVRHGQNLAFATHQGAVRNPAELLQSARTPQSLAEIEARYAPTIFLFDMPPILVNDDTMAFMEQVDCALLVAAAETTTTKEIDICERDLASQTNVMGVVLNKCRFMGSESNYGY